MSQFFQIHPDNPQGRLISQAAEIIRKGGVVAYPTDSCYGLACRIGDKASLDRICHIRRLDSKHNFTLMCRDLSEIATYAGINNSAYRLLRTFTPGPYTFILKATSEVPRRLMSKRRTIGIRVPSHPISLDLLESLGEPMMSTSLILPTESLPLIDPLEIRQHLEQQLDLIIDCGACGIGVTSVIDLTVEKPLIIREGLGDINPFI